MRVPAWVRMLFDMRVPVCARMRFDMRVRVLSLAPILSASPPSTQQRKSLIAVLVNEDDSLGESGDAAAGYSCHVAGGGAAAHCSGIDGVDASEGDDSSTTATAKATTRGGCTKAVRLRRVSHRLVNSRHGVPVQLPHSDCTVAPRGGGGGGGRGGGAGCGCLSVHRQPSRVRGFTQAGGWGEERLSGPDPSTGPGKSTASTAPPLHPENTPDVSSSSLGLYLSHCRLGAPGGSDVPPPPPPPNAGPAELLLAYEACGYAVANEFAAAAAVSCKRSPPDGLGPPKSDVSPVELVQLVTVDSFGSSSYSQPQSRSSGELIDGGAAVEAAEGAAPRESLLSPPGKGGRSSSSSRQPSWDASDPAQGQLPDCNGKSAFVYVSSGTDSQHSAPLPETRAAAGGSAADSSACNTTVNVDGQQQQLCDDYCDPEVFVVPFSVLAASPGSLDLKAVAVFHEGFVGAVTTTATVKVVDPLATHMGVTAHTAVMRGSADSQAMPGAPLPLGKSSVHSSSRGGVRGGVGGGGDSDAASVSQSKLLVVQLRNLCAFPLQVWGVTGSATMSTIHHHHHRDGTDSASGTNAASDALPSRPILCECTLPPPHATHLRLLYLPCACPHERS
eukprot:GHVU01097180.1.p1 GENE.GHVU01097180.1~~GHVU01097180.1.p1  ORF type:complete len:616 (+),score=98.32 GHVU01097180.1:2-1849(+)